MIIYTFNFYDENWNFLHEIHSTSNYKLLVDGDFKQYSGGILKRMSSKELDSFLYE